jgi:phage major head subunit gpT-like protein
MSNRITLSTDMRIEAAEGRTPTFELVAYTGAAIRQGWSRNPLVVDLAGMNTAKASIPILWSHDRSLDGVIGRSTEIVNDGSQLILRGELLGSGPVAERVIALAKAGVPLQASIGADAASIENVNSGAVVTVNGREFAGPVSVVRGSDLRETSVVLFGADGNTSAAIAAEANEGNPMSDELNQKPVEAAVPTTEAPANVAAENKVEPIVAAKGGDGASLIDVDSIAAKVVERIKADNLAAIRASRPAAPAVHVVERAEGPEVVQAALCLAGGLGGVEKTFDPRTLEAAHKRSRTIGLQEVLVEAARSNGYHGPARVTAGNIREVLASSFATHSISNVLAATYGKFLLQGYTAVEMNYEQIASIRSVSDYKTVTGVRLNGGFEFEQVSPAGELKSADASDETRTIKADLYGRMSSITMVDIVNDDLGAITAVPARLGRGAATRLNKSFWAAFEASNSTFYQAASAAAGNALAIGSLRTAASAYRKITDPDGNPLGIAPSILLVPPELEITAAELMSGSLLITGENATRTNVNVLAGRYRVVSSSYLSSSSTWWLVANPAELPAMEVAFLNGVRVPTVEQAEADFNMLGIQVRGHFSFGVAKAEGRAAYRMATA